MNGYNIIIDQNSGCVHSVDDVAYDIITNYENEDKGRIKEYILKKYKDRADVTPQDIDLCFEDIEALIKDGRLFAEDTFEKTAQEFKKGRACLKRYACMLRTTVILLADTVLPVKANMTTQRPYEL